MAGSGGPRLDTVVILGTSFPLTDTPRKPGFLKSPPRIALPSGPFLFVPYYLSPVLDPWLGPGDRLAR